MQGCAANGAANGAERGAERGADSLAKTGALNPAVVAVMASILQLQSAVQHRFKAGVEAFQSPVFETTCLLSAHHDLNAVPKIDIRGFNL